MKMKELSICISSSPVPTAQASEEAEETQSKVLLT